MEHLKEIFPTAIIHINSKSVGMSEVIGPTKTNQMGSSWKSWIVLGRNSTTKKVIEIWQDSSVSGKENICQRDLHAY